MIEGEEASGHAAGLALTSARSNDSQRGLQNYARKQPALDRGSIGFCCNEMQTYWFEINLTKLSSKTLDEYSAKAGNELARTTCHRKREKDDWVRIRLVD